MTLSRYVDRGDEESSGLSVTKRVAGICGRLRENALLAERRYISNVFIADEIIGARLSISSWRRSRRVFLNRNSLASIR